MFEILVRFGRAVGRTRITINQHENGDNAQNLACSVTVRIDPSGCGDILNHSLSFRNCGTRSGCSDPFGQFVLHAEFALFAGCA